MLDRLYRACVRRRCTVVSCWILVAVLGLLASRSLDGLLSTSLVVPGASSQRADSLLVAHFGDSEEGGFAVVLPASLVSRDGAADVGRRLADAARVLPDASVSTIVAGAGIAYAVVDTPLGLEQAARDTAQLRAALARNGLGRADLTGPPALQHDLTPVLQSDLRRGDVIALLVAFVVLVSVLGWSLAVLVPFAMALCTIALVLGALDGLARVTLLVLYVPNLVELIGLGLAIDYSLLVVRRFREQLAAGMRGDEAVLATMATAGRTVLASGSAVAVGLCVLIAIRVPFMASLGLAGLLVPLASMLAACTLLPALLAALGQRALPASRLPRAGRHRDPAGAFWPRFAALLSRRRLLLLGASLTALAAAAVPLAWLTLTPISLSAIPDSSPAARGLQLLDERISPGVASPIEIVLDSGRAGGMRTAASENATLRLAKRLLSEPQVLAVAIGTRPPYLDATGRYEQIVVIARDDLGAPSTRRLVEVVRARLVAEAGFPRGITSYVGGAPADGLDFLSRVYGTFPSVVAAVVVLTYLVLVRVFRSLLLPLMAVLLDACSVASAWGLTVLVFRFGIGARVLGLYQVSQIEGWVPVFCFAILFGLSMDYEVFLVARMGEAVERGAGHDDAIDNGLVATGGVVTAAALVMVAALSGLIAGHIAGLQELGVALGLGVLIDAAVVRCVVVPTLMGLLGRACWWLPRPLARRWRAGAAPPGRGEARPERPVRASPPGGLSPGPT